MAVSVKDDPSLPCTTFRFWVLSTLFTSLGAAVSEFYYFRSNGGGYSIFFVLLVSYIVGKWMARVLPVDEFKFYKWKFTLNPGPFNVKEHVLIAVAAGAGGGSAYGTWPSNLVFSSLFSTLHGDVSDTRDKLKFFVATFTIMFVWQFLPQFMFPLLTSIALLCLIKPYNNDIVRMGSGYHGVGILNFSLDWNAIGQPGPLYTPWWAQVNWYVGVIVGAWIIAPILYYNDFWMAKKFPLLATYSLNKDGERYNQSAIIDFNTGSLNETAYKEYGPVYLSVTFTVGYFYSFIAFTAAITHVILFYGDEIWDRFKASRSEEVEDVHCKMMRNYEGHYMKIPPKAMFTAQMWGTVVGAFVNYWILQLIIYAKRPFLDGTMRDPTGQWTGYRSQVFNTASIIWGLIGPGRTFGSDSMYHSLLWGFPIGFLAPVPFYFLHKKFPKAKFNLVTIPLICNGLSILPGTYTNFIITGFIAAYLSQRWAYHRYPKWWKNMIWIRFI
ncbi:20645_t:CDS:10 [Gigaspora margarita]|uniref:20645_t:CDS:1 n=1 Tax=Gigaspora margarita TaxID=4874 RepID=A0ABN7UYT9_GIGMA|nr:20645_t:CDS:10 [Gigaspora margarita]